MCLEIRLPRGGLNVMLRKFRKAICIVLALSAASLYAPQIGGYSVCVCAQEQSGGGVFSRHPKLKKIFEGAAIGGGLGTGLGLVTGAGAVAGAAGGAGRGAAFGAVRTTKTWERTKEKVTHRFHKDEKQQSESGIQRTY